MANENATIVLGIRIPSTDPVFLAIVGVHILFGLAAVAAGAVAMLNKRVVADTRIGERSTFGACSGCSSP